MVLFSGKTIIYLVTYIGSYINTLNVAFLYFGTMLKISIFFLFFITELRRYYYIKSFTLMIISS